MAKNKNISDNQVIDLISRKFTAAQIAGILGISRPAVSYHLRGLTKRGLIVKSGRSQWSVVGQQAEPQNEEVAATSVPENNSVAVATPTETSRQISRHNGERRPLSDRLETLVSEIDVVMQDLQLDVSGRNIDVNNKRMRTIRTGVAALKEVRSVAESSIEDNNEWAAATTSAVQQLSDGIIKEISNLQGLTPDLRTQIQKVISVQFDTCKEALRSHYDRVKSRG